MTGCTCSEPGYCDRHRCWKSPHWHQLCQTREDYFLAWEDGCGPGQTAGAASRPQTQDHRVGRELCRILGCGNHLAHVREMNDWGPDGCEEHIDQIVVWMLAAAAKRKAAMTDDAARRLILLAVAKSRKHAAAITSP